MATGDSRMGYYYSGSETRTERVNVMVHWLQIGGMRSRKENEVVQWKKIEQYLIDYPVGTYAEVYLKTTGDMFARFIRLECKQSYNDLDLDCNSCSDKSIKRLNSKPSNITVSLNPIYFYFDRYCKEAV